MFTNKSILHSLMAASGLVAAVQAYYPQDHGYYPGPHPGQLGRFQNHGDYGVGAYGHPGPYGGLSARDLYDDEEYYLGRRDIFDDEQYGSEALIARYVDDLYEEYLHARGVLSSVKSAAKSSTAKPEQSKPFDNKVGAIQKVKSVPVQGTREGVTGIGELATKKLGDHAATSWKNARVDALSTGYANSAGTGLSKNQRQSLKNQAALDKYKD